MNALVNKVGENVLPEDYLELSNGILVKNIKELSLALKKIDNESFRLHVTKSRNDFAEWVLEVYNDGVLTKKLLRTTDKNKTIKILENVLKKKNFNAKRIREPKSKKAILRTIGRVGNEM